MENALPLSYTDPGHGTTPGLIWLRYISGSRCTPGLKGINSNQHQV